MPWRPIRRCLLFGLLGLITSVVVAWGAVVHAQLRPGTGSGMMMGVAVVDGVITRVTRHRGFGWVSEGWTLQDTAVETYDAESRRKSARRIEQLGGRAYDDEVWESGVEIHELIGRTPPPMPMIIGRLDDLAAQGPPMAAPDIGEHASFDQTDVGWPMLALRSTGRFDMWGVAPNEHGIPTSIDTRQKAWNALSIPWPWPGWPQRWTADTLTLPYKPRPGLALNTIFYGLLWALVLLAPGALRRTNRLARGCCTKCGFSLAGQPRPGCPECGHGRRRLAT